MYRYTYIVSGGTFDHLHQGHKIFLLEQLRISKYLLVGVTSNAYIQHYKSEQDIQPYDLRIASLKEFLQKENIADRVFIEPIDDAMIPPAFEKYNIEAIAVTEDTKKGAETIVVKREKEGKSPLEIIVIPSVIGADDIRISSSRIRKGEIGRVGEVYIKPEWLSFSLQLPYTLRSELKKPFGPIFSRIEDWLEKNKVSPTTIITIGDEVSELLFKKGFGQKVSVVDLYVQRERRYPTLSNHALQGNEHIISLHNPAGYITPQLFTAARTSIFSKGNYVINITGEEDLAVLPFVLVAPLNFQILYGQPNEGIVAIFITNDIKKRAMNLLEKFTILALK
jgi:cytidyltransferase-like protein